MNLDKLTNQQILAGEKHDKKTTFGAFFPLTELRGILPEFSRIFHGFFTDFPRIFHGFVFAIDGFLTFLRKNIYIHHLCKFLKVAKYNYIFVYVD